MSIMLRSIFKTLYYNFKIFSLKDAVKLPLFVGDTTVIKGSRKGCICIKGAKIRGILSIGRSFGSYGVYRGIKSVLHFGERGVLVIHGRTAFCTEFKVSIDGILDLGENFDANNGFNCICKENISFGSGCLLGWNVTVLDSDGHRMTVNGKSIKETVPVNIGSNVWMGAKTTILKGSCVKDNTVVGYGTLVSGSYDDNSIIVGDKGKGMKKDNIVWMK